MIQADYFHLLPRPSIPRRLRWPGNEGGYVALQLESSLPCQGVK
jgi:hypothetical protein